MSTDMWFGSPVYHTILAPELAALIDTEFKDAEKAIRDNSVPMDQDGEYVLTNRGMRGDFLITHGQHRLRSVVLSELENFCNEIGGTPDGYHCRTVVDRSWINIFKEAGYMNAHRHGATFSAVYFLKNDMPASGNIVFENSIALNQADDGFWTEQSWMTQRRCNYPAIPGSLLIFPGWLMHSVNRAIGTKPGDERISVSINMKRTYVKE